MYVWPNDPKVYENLIKWQSRKFGVLIHMGLYSQLGIVESWALCPEDEDWISRKGYTDYFKFASDYRNTQNIFNPKDFNPEKWAKAIKISGAGYMIFSMKHHDGFCMFDSKFTDFKITEKICPFSVNPNANISRAVFKAFRDTGLSVGAYFSKPDWTSPYFWWPYFPPKDRNPNYNINRHPDCWKKFIEYTHNQLREIITEYGELDILWLDGCWVRPIATINKDVEEFCKYPYDLDIDLKTFADDAREKQPGILIVDRWVPGEYENYLTPEQKMPEKPLGVPWESCITLGNAWGWVPNDSYKSGRELIHLLVTIAAKGGNLLLGIGPNGNGEFEPIVYERLNEIGQWLKINGEAIYNTTTIEPFHEGKIAYTTKDKNIIYAIYLTEDNETALPYELHVKTAIKHNLKINLLADNHNLDYKQVSDGLMVIIPETLRTQLAKQAAVVIKICLF